MTFHRIDSQDLPPLAAVGGKGLSLIKMARAGLPVPGGFILPVGFFAPWIDLIFADPARCLAASDAEAVTTEKIARQRAVAAALAFTPEQKKTVADAFASLGRSLPVFSVRSSSPEEDLEGASFAGVYETVLGVTPEKLEEKVRVVFLSCLDARVVAYKRQHGFDFTRSEIAVVVQEQIASEVAGVGFSLNPLSNCFDEAVINASWGLGESVVSGEVVPDRFTVDKLSLAVLERHIGGKAKGLFLGEGGKVGERVTVGQTGVSLDDAQVQELTRLILRIEQYYGMPMDIEWAWAGGTFHLLQARPITTSIPLPAPLLTGPGERRKAYLDLTLVEQGIQNPLSTLGCQWFGEVSRQMVLQAAGEDYVILESDLAAGTGKTGLMFAVGGRCYVDLSACLKLQSQESLAKSFEGLDTYAAKVIRHLDPKEYKAEHLPPHIARATLKGIVKSADTVAKVVQGALFPRKLERSMLASIEAYKKRIQAIARSETNLRKLYDALTTEIAALMIHATIPSLGDSETARGMLRDLFKKESEEIRRLADKLDQGLPHNVTVEMSAAIYRLSQMLEKNAYGDLTALAGKIAKREMPQGFLVEWDDFMQKYGFRGAREVDLATPRYQDKPELLLEQMKAFAGITDPAFSPIAIHERQETERHQAFAKLQEFAHAKGWIFSKELGQLYTVIETLGGYREMHKYCMVMVGYILRQRFLEAGRKLAQAGRIDRPEEIFALRVEQIESALADPKIECRALARENGAFLDRIAHIRNFPAVIDSRGRIPKPPARALGPNELAGEPVSMGRIRGTARLVHYVGEKEIQEGEIIVAKVADPGWTPLFIHASGILLEVGGMLQHGSLIAREYGKPCIAGIEGLTSRIQDGDQVEMDGAEGIVRKL